MPQKIVDEYLWIPNVDVNLKFRLGTGSQDGLKFKRLNDTRGAIEKWTESAAEIFPFPLSRQAWDSLQKDMKIPLGAPFNPPVDANPAEAIRFLQSVEPRARTVIVRKLRCSGIWGESGNVKVELAEIATPCKTSSVGLEIREPFCRLDDAHSIALLAKAAADLKLDEEPLEAMNYLDYIRRCVE